MGFGQDDPISQSASMMSKYPNVSAHKAYEKWMMSKNGMRVISHVGQIGISRSSLLIFGWSQC